jgi:hypothetical protein
LGTIRPVRRSARTRRLRAVLAQAPLAMAFIVIGGRSSLDNGNAKLARDRASRAAGMETILPTEGFGPDLRRLAGHSVDPDALPMRGRRSVSRSRTAIHSKRPTPSPSGPRTQGGGSRSSRRDAQRTSPCRQREDQDRLERVKPQLEDSNRNRSREDDEDPGYETDLDRSSSSAFDGWRRRAGSRERLQHSRRRRHTGSLCV